MEAAPSAKPRREPAPIPPNYVSLQQLQELRLKEKEEEEEEKRQREEEAAAAAKRAAVLKAEAALKAETKGSAVSREAFYGAKERHRGKGKGKKKAFSCHTVGEPGNLAELVPATSNGGKPENKSELKAMGKASRGAPPDPAKAAVASSPGHLTCKGRKGAGDRSAETSRGDAPVKTAGPSPPRGVKSGNTGKTKPADAGTGSDCPEGKEAAPAQAPPTSAADGCSKPKSGGKLRKTMEAKPEGLVEGQRWQTVVEVQAVTGLNPRIARRSAQPWGSRGIGAAQPQGLVWVPKAAAAAAGSSAGAGDK